VIHVVYAAVRNSAYLVIDKMKEGASQTHKSTNTTSANQFNNMNISNNNTATNNDDNTLEVIEQLQNMSLNDINVVASVCANCGKEDAKNICNKCKQVKYCNAVCKKVHKKKHKKDCEEYVRLATEKHNEELRIAAELHDIELFKPPPQLFGDCPICFVRLPLLMTGSKYMTCCGKVICSGCIHAPLYDNQGNEVDNEKQNECPFCRTLAPKSDLELNRMRKKRVDLDDPLAIYGLGCYSREGTNGYAQDYTKALELYHRAAELGYSAAYTSIGSAYHNGEGVEVDKKKAEHYFEIAAMRGDVTARCNLGSNEGRGGNVDRALKHFMMAVRGGYNESLEMIQKLYSNGLATKENYAKALQTYQEYLGEIRSSQRDEAAAASEEYRYY